MSPWIAVILVLVVILAGGIVVGKIRKKCAKSIVVTLTMQPQAHCRNEFVADGTVKVTYPAAGNPALTTVSLSHTHQLAPSHNISSSGPSPGTLTFRQPGQQNFQFTGSLRDPCRDGQLSIFAEATCGDSNPSDINLARITQAPQRIVSTKGFDLISPLPQNVHSTPAFSVDFKFKCCGGVPVTINSNPIQNVAITSTNPDVIACVAGQQHTVTISGNRPDPSKAGQFRVTATTTGVTCTVGVVDVE